VVSPYWWSNPHARPQTGVFDAKLASPARGQSGHRSWASVSAVDEGVSSLHLLRRLYVIGLNSPEAAHTTHPHPPLGRRPLAHVQVALGFWGVLVVKVIQWPSGRARACACVCVSVCVCACVCYYHA
jgi:hypothetical protein